MNNIKKGFVAVVFIAVFTGCKKDTDPVFISTPSSGSELLKLNGIAGAEPGSVAGNSVYIDLSTEKTTPTLRSGWDLGFFSGADFRVVLNSTASAGAKITGKFDISTVGVSDTIGLVLATSQFNPQPGDFAYFDNISGNISQTIIPAISAADAENPVIILNRGTGGAIPARPWIKLRILRNGNAGYTIQYAGIQESVFKTINVTKNEAYNFQFISFDSGVVLPEPEKLKWDLVWTYSQYHANFGSGFVPYNFSDLIAVNHLAGVQVKERKYTDATTANAAYNVFTKDSVNVMPPVSGRWTIANNWLSTQPVTGARLDRFYVIKDAQGNFYKFKCLNMGVGTDGGTRGKPEFKYSLIQ